MSSRIDEKKLTWPKNKEKRLKEELIVCVRRREEGAICIIYKRTEEPRVTVFYCYSKNNSLCLEVYLDFSNLKCYVTYYRGVLRLVHHRYNVLIVYH